MTNKDFEYAKRFEDWLKGENLDGIQEDVFKLRIEYEKLRKENTKLQQQIKLMRRCSNCIHPINKQDCNCNECTNYSNWVLQTVDFNPNLKEPESEKDDTLTKAKELLKKMYYLYFDPCVTEQDLDNSGKLFEEVNQFIKEIEKNDKETT